MQDEFSRPPYPGLTEAEVTARREEGKINAQPRAAGKSTPQIIADNVFTLFNLLNLVLAAALIAVGAYRNLLFLGVVVCNTFIGTVQELRAKRTIDRLQLLSAPMAEVIRDGKPAQVAMEDLVLDDLVVLRAGNQICADAEVMQGEGAVDESLLTGESEPVEKRTGMPLLSGSYVTEGMLYARVTRVGEESYAAQLTIKARAIKQPDSELMRSMQIIIRGVSAVLLPLGLILFFKQYFLLRADIQGAVTSTVGAMLGMIPEGLILLTSMSLAVGVIRLGQRGTLVQQLYGIESLARVDTLCLDKTGTITRGTMAVAAVEPLNGIAMEAVEQRVSALVAALPDNNATFAALRERFASNVVWRATYTAPFSSARKWSAASFDAQGTSVIGAAQFILGPAMEASLIERINEHAREGRRVLLLCHSPEEMREKTLPAGLTPCALIALTDILRDDAAETIDFFTQQDVRLRVISGDDPVTVMSVARLAGLPDAEKAVDATTLDTPEKLEEAATRYTVFGRVTPEQKKDLVLAMKRQGHTVGMMGDGVNDIPALKAADCSIAMSGGSDAARRVSQITLLNETFSTVPQVVMEGRRVINNITRAASLFLVKTTFSFLLSLLLVFIHRQYPFAPIQMTLISAMTVGVPSFFLAMAPNSARVQGNFLYNVLRNALPGGLTIVLEILVIYAVADWMGMDEDAISTVATWVTGFTGLCTLAFTSRPLNLWRGLLVAAMAVGFVGAGLLFGKVFYLVPLTPPLLILTGGLSILAPVLMALMRWGIRRIMK